MITVYKSVNSPTPEGVMQVNNCLKAIKDSRFKSTIAEAREVKKNFKRSLDHGHRQEADAFEAEYKRLKTTEVPVFTWNGVFTYRSNKNLESFSGYMYFDTDGIVCKEEAMEHPSTVAAWKSFGGDGTGWIVKVENVTKQNFLGNYNHLRQCFLSIGIDTDNTYDIARCNVLSHDPMIFTRLEAPAYVCDDNLVEKEDKYEPKLDLAKVKDSEAEYCMQAYYNCLKRGLRFIPGQRHHFTISYFGATLSFGVSLHDAYMFLVMQGSTSKDTLQKGEDVYRRYSHQYGKYRGKPKAK